MLTPDGYMPRLVDSELDIMLKTFGAVCIEGPKWCGKTWTAMNKCNSSINISQGNPTAHSIVSVDRNYAFKGETPRLIDEWQDVPDIWDATKIKVDESRETGRFILTGSSTPRNKGVSHSGAGRIGSLRMRPMSLFESGDSDGSVSLKGLFEGTFENVGTKEPSLERLIDLTIRGGWPYLVGRDPIGHVLANREYLQRIVDSACRMDGVERNQTKMMMVFRSLARNECIVSGVSRIVSDIRDNDDVSISNMTVDTYLDILSRLFITDDLPAFSTNYRSSVRIGKSPKRRFVDPSIAVAALRLTRDKLINDLNTYGSLFESMCERDLSVYASANGAKLFHYRDDKGREIDSVMEMPDGRWGMFEIKLGANQIDRAAESLLRMHDIFPDEDKPSVLCVLCGMVPYAYRRSDGVYVVPITALRD